MAFGGLLVRFEWRRVGLVLVRLVFPGWRVGAGVLGFVSIGAHAWLFLRPPRRGKLRVLGFVSFSRPVGRLSGSFGSFPG